MMELLDSVASLKGVGPKTLKLLQNLNIHTVYDLLCDLPRAYRDFSAVTPVSGLEDGKEAAVRVTVEEQPSLRRIRRNLSILRFAAGDGTGRLTVSVFNQPYLQNSIRPGQSLYLLGRVQKKGFGAHMDNPAMLRSRPEDPILPVYRLTAGLTQHALQNAVKQALAEAASPEDVFSEEFRRRHGLCGADSAFSNIHFPKDMDALARARRRLLFEELLLFSAMLDRLSEGETQAGVRFACPDEWAVRFTEMLSFTPTGAQRRAMREMMDDWESGRAMNRLIQGDVGCGKTMLAFFAMYVCVKNGCQCAMMAPTEVLARQHFESAFRLFGGEGINVELVTGSLTAAQRNRIAGLIAGGQAHMVIGTHALLYGNMEFFRLGLIVTDEQHRFGVRQRARLARKGEAPHTLIMSATPIPRTLALILYGKTDVSVVDEMPPGRLPVKTRCVPPGRRRDMYHYVKKELQHGGQAYVVCPLIEKNEEYGANAAEEIYNELKDVFSGMDIALLHGRMKTEEKMRAVRRFAEGACRLLVSTTVIEVGINVPNATVMVVENAECFGLAQLHQLRGRVGRGEKPSYCFLVTGNGAARERLDILTRSNDGFYIAEKDLELRGPGEFLGTRQNGVGDLYMADLMRDMGLITETRDLYARMKRENDPSLPAIQQAAQRRFQRRFEEIAMN